MGIQPGTNIEFRSFAPITLDQLKDYAQASGDFNPIHTDESVAKKAGLPGIIAHGMLIAALMAERALQFVAETPSLKGYSLSLFQTRFKAMTFLGDVPGIGGTVKEMTEGMIVLDLQVKNQKGELTTIGTATLKAS